MAPESPGAAGSEKQDGKTRLAPEDAFVHARKLHQGGKRSEAEALYRKILRAAPDHAGSLHYLGLLLFQSGKQEQGIEHLRRSLVLEPHDPTYHSHFGVAFEKQEKFYEAEGAYRRAVELEPDAAEHHFSLGVVLQKQERLEEAEAAYRRALELYADYPDALNNLGSVLQEQKKLMEAAAAYREAIRLTPDDPALHNNLGSMLTASNKIEAAVTAYREAIALKPDYVKALNNLSGALRTLGRHDEAEAVSIRAIEAEPSNVDAHYDYVLAHRFVPGDPEIETLKALLARDDQTEKSKRHLLAALGKVHDDIAEYGQAFSYYQRANKMKSSGAGFDAPGHREHIEDIKRVFQKREAVLAAEPGDRVPVFIVGLSRAGKSLAESLLAKHPEVYGAGERQELQNCAKVMLEKIGVTQSYPDFMAELSPEQLREIGSCYMEALVQHAPESRFFVNTLPGYHLYVGLILKALPGAKIVFCHRHPLDNCLFVFFKQYKFGHDYSYNLELLASYYDSYQDMMAHWLSLYGEEILSLRYEDMVQDPADAAARLYRHCGLDPDPAAAHEAFRTDQLGKWKHYERDLGPLILKLANVGDRD